MGLFVPDMLDNETEAHLALSVRLIAYGWGFAGVMCGIWFLTLILGRIF
jgi:hypothetical protein